MRKTVLYSGQIRKIAAMALGCNALPFEYVSTLVRVHMAVPYLRFF